MWFLLAVRLRVVMHVQIHNSFAQARLNMADESQPRTMYPKQTAPTTLQIPPGLPRPLVHPDHVSSRPEPKSHTVSHLDTQDGRASNPLDKQIRNTKSVLFLNGERGLTLILTNAMQVIHLDAHHAIKESILVLVKCSPRQVGNSCNRVA